MRARTRGLLCLALCGAGCSPPRPAVLHSPTTPLSAEDFPVVLSTWTRTDKVYQGLDNKLFVTATYHAPELRRAFAIAFPEIYGHGGTVTRQELVDLTPAAEQSNTFFLAAYTPDTKWNDLAQTDSIWRVTLIGDNEVAAAPVEIQQVKVDENLRVVYPYIGRFDRCYLVRFPLADPMERLVIDPGGTGFRLRVASALGAAELVWQLSPPP
jgi:hypothetical protein